MMLPILEPSSRTAARLRPRSRHRVPARQLPARRRARTCAAGRIYLPQESLRLFGVTRERLLTGVVDGPVRRLLAHEIARCRELFRSAEPGIRLLHPTLARLHPYRLHAVRRDPRRHRGGRLPGARPAGQRWRSPAGSPSPVRRLWRARARRRRSPVSAAPTTPTTKASAAPGRTRRARSSTGAPAMRSPRIVAGVVAHDVRGRSARRC